MQKMDLIKSKKNKSAHLFKLFFLSYFAFYFIILLITAGCALCSKNYSTKLAIARAKHRYMQPRIVS